MIIEILKRYKIVLASASPRRQDLLRRMGIEFTTLSLDVDEAIEEGIQPDAAAILLSERKAAAIPDDMVDEQTLFITADTIVALGGTILGKPASRDEALEMLRMLSGREHMVYTGVTLRSGDSSRSFVSGSKVRFIQLT